MKGLKSLGLHHYNGAALTDSQLAQIKAQTKKVNDAMEQWLPLVNQWILAVERHEAPPAEVREKVAKIYDQTEMLGLEWAIWRKVSSKKSQQHQMALALIQALADNPRPVAAQSLTRQAVFSDFEDVRAAAITALKRRPFDHYVPLLLSGLQSPIEADLQCVLALTEH